jgi:hypothetical protein
LSYQSTHDYRHGKLTEKRLLTLLRLDLCDCLLDSLAEEECVDGLLLLAEELGLEPVDFCSVRDTGGSTCCRHVYTYSPF